jgi:hypothetical protein
MSRVYFHSPSATAHLSGAERANAGFMIDKIGLSLLRALDPYSADVAWMGRCVEPSPGDLSDPRNLRHLATHLRFGGDVAFVAADGTRHGVWTVLLNTAMRVGSRPMKFLARMHAQCEIHGWVEGRNRAWLAKIVDQGLKDRLYREGMGWDEVRTLLRARDDEPVVMSYSVCMQFPNESAAGFEAPEDDEGEAWDALPTEEQWRLGMEGLRAQGGGLELKPEWFDDYHFGSGATAFTIEGLCADERTA